MTSPNPLVAGPVDVTTPFSGTFLLEDGEALAAAIESGDWVSGGMAAFSAAIDTAATVSDPLGSLIAAGLGWVMDHIEPLKGWMNDLTGDAGEVAGFAATWRNVSTQLGMSGEELQRIMSDVDAMHGDAIEAYRAFQVEVGNHLNAAGTWSDAMATGLDICSTIVKIVHDITRDAISTIVGAIISYAAELVFSLGLATPLVIEQVSTRVASLAGRVGKAITRLLESGKALKGLLDKLQALLKQATELFDKVLKNSPTPVKPGAGAPTPVKPPKAPKTPKPFGPQNKPYLDGTRPSFRKGVVQQVWDEAVRQSQLRGDGGRVFDPNTGDEIFWTPGQTRVGSWDMGHIAGQKYDDMLQEYKAGNLTPAEFRDWYNDPRNYLPETPGSNRSRKFD